jgi:hypothetical protein
MKRQTGLEAVEPCRLQARSNLLIAISTGIAWVAVRTTLVVPKDKPLPAEKTIARVVMVNHC